MKIDIDFLRKNNLILFEAVSGSHAYNLATENSDIDIRGVFILPPEMYFGLIEVSQVSDEKQDIVFYELKRFFELLLKSNPTILELLFMPKDTIRFEHQLWSLIPKKKFLSKNCENTFMGYAHSQIKKAQGLNKKIVNPVAKEKKTLIQFCNVLKGQGSISLEKWLQENNFKQENCALVKIDKMRDMYALFYDKNNQFNYQGIIRKQYANEVALSSVPKEEKPVAWLSVNQDGYSSYCKEYKEYWDWVEKRNEARYQSNIEHQKNYDSKNMMHTFRLLEAAEEIACFQKLSIKTQNRDFLMNVRNGKYQYDELLQIANEKIQKNKIDFQNSKLPQEPDKNLAHQLSFQIREQFYKKIKTN